MSDIISQIYDELGEQIIADIIQQYSEHDSIVTGEAMQSWKIDNKNGEVYSESEGAFFHEHGRRPNQRPPPISEIRKWCRLKGIPVRKAWGIRNNIGKYGIKPAGFIRKYCEDNNLEYSYAP